MTSLAIIQNVTLSWRCVIIDPDVNEITSTCHWLDIHVCVPICVLIIFSKWQALSQTHICYQPAMSSQDNPSFPPTAKKPRKVFGYVGPNPDSMRWKEHVSDAAHSFVGYHCD